MLAIQPKDKKCIIFIYNYYDIWIFKLSFNFVHSVEESQLVLY